MFIIVSGDCQRTCFTMSIATLIRIPVPVMHATAEQIKIAVS